MDEKEHKLTSMDISTFGGDSSDSKKDFKKGSKGFKGPKAKDVSDLKKEVMSKPFPTKEEKESTSAADAAKEMEFDSDENMDKKPKIIRSAKKIPKK